VDKIGFWSGQQTAGGAQAKELRSSVVWEQSDNNNKDNNNSNSNNNKDRQAGEAATTLGHVRSVDVVVKKQRSRGICL